MTQNDVFIRPIFSFQVSLWFDTEAESGGASQ